MEISNSSSNNIIMANQKIASQISEAIKSLPDGEITGKVLDVNNKIAQILTDDGQLVRGKLQFANQLNIGDIRQFTISTDKNGTTFFSIVPEDSSKLVETNIKNALMELGIKNSPENINIAKELIKNNLPINKDQFQQISKANILLGDNSNKLNNAIFMLKNNIPITQNNIKILTDFTANSFKVSSSITQIHEQINNLPEGTLKDSLLNILNLPKENTTTTQSNLNTQINLPQNTDTPVLKNELPVQNTNNTNANNTNMNNIELKFDQNITQKNGIINEDSSTKILNTPEKHNLIADKLFETQEDLKEILPNEKNIINSENKWLNKFEIAKSSLNDLDEYNKDANHKIENLIKELEKHDTPESKAILENLNNVKERLLFTNNLKENFYVQIPLNINKNETLEILVYKDKNKKTNSKNSTSAIIGLDTANLGRFETFLEKENNNINFQFKLENEEIIKLVKKNIGQLENLLKEKNLNISSISYSEINNKFNITTENKENKDISNNFKLNIKM